MHNKTTQEIGIVSDFGYMLDSHFNFQKAAIALSSVKPGWKEHPGFPEFLLTEAWESGGSVWVNAERDLAHLRGYWDRSIGEWVDVNFKLLCLDVDGSLGKPKSGGDFRERADDWDFFPGRVRACQKLVATGVKIIMVSNQGGVCFPWSKFTEAQIASVLEETARTIGAISLYSCSSASEKALPEYFKANDPRRKPNPGMLIEARDLAGVDLSEILMVGDRPEDEKAAQAAGVAFMWAKDFFGD